MSLLSSKLIFKYSCHINKIIRCRDYFTHHINTKTLKKLKFKIKISKINVNFFHSNKLGHQVKLI